ncbi:RNA 2'-phosphotransferase [Xenorhabdus nematophila]|uniref:RNA 2'-phosphotransferase n=1 Tax=Xenorhabdus nematophila TaxID=628 RepID=UPI00032752F9|nr:RNA 2'-phosphotransferase [Xenorhabdus nematophila]CEE94554.1 2'-phosphotransferase [Xenorhabdus nematophila str. Anatoliense]CEF29687.1 2'-phosphotransferase [Xenorhabdus nematophila str. Websteri]AYA41272.1 RNA 2'-phosphotransferase [Xenorhabdus nematophila]KHD29861.1 RNA 2'-phosphotransferase [Xenorhabdus nematophila]MBA0020008.1 RNA 2'-phosphotransferase [Xenorhabdus nematophila]
MDQSDRKISKFLSYVLRHQPESIGLTLDSEGWADIGTLIKCAAKYGKRLNRVIIENIVESNDKKRFSISADQKHIRAVQGHSTQKVDIRYQEKIPSAVLYHGTATRFLDSIFKQGLVAGTRHYVHLSADESTAIKVGQRHGNAIILKIAAQLMYEQGFKFHQADNGVWLTKSVPVEYMEVI